MYLRKGNYCYKSNHVYNFYLMKYNLFFGGTRKYFLGGQENEKVFIDHSCFCRYGVKRM